MVNEIKGLVNITTGEEIIDADFRYVNIDGSQPLTADWDIGDNRKISADKISARDGAGLYLVDDGNNGVFVKDGGSVGIGTTDPNTKLHIVGGTDASLSGGGYLVTGSITGTNLVIDENEIMARNNGSTSPFYLQHDGGNVLIGAGGAPSERLEVEGRIKSKGMVSVSTTLNSATPYEAIDTSANSIFFADTTSNNVDIRTFANGVAGQVIYVIKTSAYNTLTFRYNYGGSNQRMLCTGTGDYVVGAGDQRVVTLIFDGSWWYTSV